MGKALPAKEVQIDNRRRRISPSQEMTKMIGSVKEQGWSVGGGKGSDANTTAHNVPLGTDPEP